MGFSLRKLIGGIAPLIATGLGGPIAGGFVGKLLKETTGTDDVDEAEKILQADPALYLKFQTKLMEAETEQARIVDENLTARQGQVNTTMQAELVSGSKWQKGWRPFNGYMFPIAIISCYFILPISGKEVPPIPWEMWVLWASVLGVSAHSRGKEKLTAMGNQGSGILGTLIKGFKR